MCVPPISGNGSEPGPRRFAEGATVAPSGLGLGIDAGGTYTDAVLFDLTERRVLAKAKALTTYHDLVEGIRAALAQLPEAELARVEVTSLSTTLATNAIVEGRGHKVGLLVLSPWDWFADEIGHAPCIRVPGSVDITGAILEPLDEDACRAAIRQLVDEERCAALVVAGYATTANPDQANRVRALIREMTDFPVVCAHEVSRRLNAVQGAQTAVTNARLLPVISHLMDAVRRALSDFHVPGRLLVVKGDGTPVDESVARERPIETILSGPAASVSGAKLLTGLSDALVMDVGGTTTDCAVLENGHVAVAPDGTRVGSWVMSVDVVEMLTVGLGGDSRLDFTSKRELLVGPRRNVPLCYLAAQHPPIARFLRDFDLKPWRAAPNAGALDVLVRGTPGRLALSGQEAELMALLESEPLPAIEAAERLGLPFPLLPTVTRRLEGCGMVQRGALTPTDLLHVRGEYTRWDADAARRALDLFSAMYGQSREATLHAAMHLVTRRLFEEAIRREASRENRGMHTLPAGWKDLLDRAFEPDGKAFSVRVSLRRPIIALGAPAATLVPPLTRHLDVEVIVPEHADVANAVGAIGTDIVVREEVLIRPDRLAKYVLHGTEERVAFTDLKEATARAVEIAQTRVRQRALKAGALVPEVKVTHHDQEVSVGGDEMLFLERRVLAVASGSAFARPAA